MATGVQKMEAKRLDGTTAAIEPAAFDAFKASLRGKTIRPGEPGYDEARALWNAMIDRRPALIVQPSGTADVVKCVNFAREHKILISVKGGGHNIAGLAACDGGLMIDMSHLRGVWVDPVGKRARAQAGCLLGDVDRETQVHGLATVLGFVSATGIAGLTTGGGFGYLTRRWGWTSDNLLSAEVVTADGKVVTASEKSSPDLFWAIRGGSGNFGIVTSFEYALHPVGPEIVGGPTAWPASETDSVLTLFREMVAKAPPELTLVVLSRPAPPAPWIAKEMHGKPVIILLAVHTGPVEQAERDLAPIRNHGKSVGNALAKRPYAQMQALLDATQPKGRRYYWKSEYVPAASKQVCDMIAAHGAKIVSPHSAIAFFQLDGALNKVPSDHSAVGNRDAKLVVNITASWERAEDDKANVEWARAAWRDLRPHSTGGVYVNFLTEEEGAERVAAAYGEANLERLQAIKKKYDPEDLFRHTKRIGGA